MRLAEFRPVPGFEGIYEVNGLGMIWSIPRKVRISHGAHRTTPGRFLSPSPVSGYPAVGLQVDGVNRTFYVHRLVAEAFLGKPPDGLQVCHGNGDKSDCRVSNLRYDTQSGNEMDKLAHGTHCRGQLNHGAKLTEDKVLQIRADTRVHRAIAREFGIAYQTVSEIKRGEIWGWLESAA